MSYFNKLTYNNTISQRISSATGYKSRLMNIDEEYVRRGVEISIDATPVQVRDFSWDVSLNLSTSKRYYAKLDENFSRIICGHTWALVRILIHIKAMTKIRMVIILLIRMA